jgi:hypothetical protein
MEGGGAWLACQKQAVGWYPRCSVHARVVSLSVFFVCMWYRRGGGEGRSSCRHPSFLAPTMLLLPLSLPHDCESQMPGVVLRFRSAYREGTVTHAAA